MGLIPVHFHTQWSYGRFPPCGYTHLEASFGMYWTYPQNNYNSSIFTWHLAKTTKMLKKYIYQRAGAAAICVCADITVFSTWTRPRRVKPRDTNPPCHPQGRKRTYLSKSDILVLCVYRILTDLGDYVALSPTLAPPRKSANLGLQMPVLLRSRRSLRCSKD